MTVRPELEYARAVLGDAFVPGGSLGCSGEFARALGLPGLEVDLNGRHSVPGVSRHDDACVLLAGDEPVAAATYNMLGRPYSVRRDFWDCIVVLMAQAHPSPPAELAACASLVLAQGEVCTAWRREGFP